jgi:hypothetical protein
MVVFNPSRVDKVVGFVSVGFTYGYSRGGPLRGHNHPTFYTPNFCVAHPSGRLPRSESLRLEDFNGPETRRFFHNRIRRGKLM